MAGDMDINCGEIADGTATLDEMGERILDLMLKTASGERSRSERLGYGDEEFVPWSFGAMY
jgi:altronate hydrolase